MTLEKILDHITALERTGSEILRELKELNSKYAAIQEQQAEVDEQSVRNMNLWNEGVANILGYQGEMKHE